MNQGLVHSRLARSLFHACIGGAVVVAGAGLVTAYLLMRRDRRARRPRGIEAAIGGTPLVELHSLSAATGCRILAKCEQLNPGGSVKDRAAVFIVNAAEKSGALKPGGTIVEGTGGNTGIALAIVAATRGYRAIFTVPENTSKEKVDAARAFGAEVIVCPLVPFSDSRHYYHVAKTTAEGIPGAVWGSQFENMANGQAHYETTGPEIWAATEGDVDALVCAAGTGGTISGLSRYFKQRRPDTRVFLIDPPGSALASVVETGSIVPPAAGTPATIAEGIGLGRVTANFAAAQIDSVLHGTDAEIVQMASYLMAKEGVCVGPSACLNVIGAVRAAWALGPGHTIVTILCDSGARYASKLYNASWLASQQPPLVFPPPLSLNFLGPRPCGAEAPPAATT